MVIINLFCEIYLKVIKFKFIRMLFFKKCGKIYIDVRSCNINLLEKKAYVDDNLDYVRNEEIELYEQNFA